MTVEEILDTAGISYRLTQGGSGLQAQIHECPWCGSSDNRTYVNMDTGLGNCFKAQCIGGFNKYELIKRVNGFSTHAQITAYVQGSGNNVIQRLMYNKPSAEAKFDGELNLSESVEASRSARAMGYLESRRCSRETADYFGLRYTESGIYRYQFQSQEHTQDFSERIIFPIFDLDGNTVSYQGRDVTGSNPIRYLFPMGFSSTGSYLYNAHNEADCSTLVLSEGVFDVVSAKVAIKSDPLNCVGFGAVGTFGTSVGEGQIRTLETLRRERSLKRLIFLWDSERSALRSALKSSLLLTRRGFECSVAILPPGKDPGQCSFSEILASIKDRREVKPQTVVGLRRDIET